MCDAIEIVGDKNQRPIVVQAEFEKSIIRVDPDGSVPWVFRTSKSFKGNFVYQTEDTISFTYRKSIITLNKHTGKKVSTYRPDTKKRIFAYRIDDDLIAYAEHTLEDGRVVIESKKSRRNRYTVGTVFVSKHKVSAPRGIELLNNKILVVGDTFNHRVIGINIETDEIEFQIDDYYPSMGHVISDHEILIVAEHANRIYKYDIVTGDKEWVYGCKAHPIFGELDRPYTDIIELGHTGALTHTNGMGVCAVEYNRNKETLYSVGGVVRNQDGTLLISDTDNHRVIHITEHGKFIREIKNINNPIRAMEIF